MKVNKLTGIALATAAAGMFAITAAGPVGAQILEVPAGKGKRTLVSSQVNGNCQFAVEPK